MGVTTSSTSRTPQLDNHSLNLSGDDFTAFSDPWSCVSKSSNSSSKQRGDPAGKLATSVEVEPPPSDAWDDLNVSAVVTRNDPPLPRDDPPQPAKNKEPTPPSRVRNNRTITTKQQQQQPAGAVPALTTTYGYHARPAPALDNSHMYLSTDTSDDEDDCSDINTVTESLFDPFAERDLLPPRVMPPTVLEQQPREAAAPPLVTSSTTANGGTSNRSNSRRQSSSNSTGHPSIGAAPMVSPAAAMPALVTNPTTANGGTSNRSSSRRQSSSSSTRPPSIGAAPMVSPAAATPAANNYNDARYSGSKWTEASSDIFTYDEGSRRAIAVSPPSPEQPEDDDDDSHCSSSMSELQPRRELVQPQRSYLPAGLSPQKKIQPPAPSLAGSTSSSSGSDEHYETPFKAMAAKAVPPPPVAAVVSSPDVVSELTTPHKGAPRYAETSKMLQRYSMLLEDPAYWHAAQAGFLWQSMVGQHVRFPLTWWDGARGPPMGCCDDGDSDAPGQWRYLNRQTVADNPVLNQLVKCRASGGRLLLHIIVQDLMTRTPVQDIVIGCFHPNAKGIRTTDRALGRFEKSRDVWMGVRKRSAIAVSAVDSLLYSCTDDNGAAAAEDDDEWLDSGRRNDNERVDGTSRSPLGHGRRVTNTNVRSVFGEKSPLETIFVAEDELYERLSNRILDQSVTPAMAILQEFVFA